MDKIFFFHNPKAGGTSIKKVLENLYQKRQRCPQIENDEIDHRNLQGNYKAFRGYAFYSGHYGLDIYGALASGHFPVTNFRHPVDRMISTFNYFNYAVQLPPRFTLPDHFYHVRLARTISFEDFISSSDPRVEIYTRNGHFRQLTHSPWSPKLHSSLDAAIAFIDQMPWFYLCEFPETSTEWFRRAFNLAVDEIPRENRTPKLSPEQVSPSNISETTRNLILEKNQLDLALYEHAVERLRLIQEKLNLSASEAARPA
jgi:hypothetical protein